MPPRLLNRSTQFLGAVLQGLKMYGVDVIRDHYYFDAQGPIGGTLHVARGKVRLAQFMVCESKNRGAGIEFAIVTAGVNKSPLYAESSFKEGQFVIDVIDIGNGVSKFDHFSKGSRVRSDSFLTEQSQFNRVIESPEAPDRIFLRRTWLWEKFVGIRTLAEPGLKRPQKP